MSPAPILGISAIGRRLGLSRQRVHVLVERDDFPAPVHELPTGRVWRGSDVERWIGRNPRYDHTTDEAPPAPRRRETTSEVSAEPHGRR